MKSAIKKLKARESSPIINFAQHSTAANKKLSKELLPFSLMVSAAARDNNRTLVDEYKSRLGKESYCMTMYRRYWVWEYKHYRIYVNNEAGLSVELIVDQNFKPIAQPESCWAEFVSRVCQSSEEIDIVTKAKVFDKWIKDRRKKWTKTKSRR